MNLTKPRILVVDDEPLNCDILEEHLSDAGYDTVCAYDGVEGLEVLKEDKGKFDAILLDRMMPNMNGIEMFKEIKANKNYKNIPVIMQTAAASKNEVVEGISAGVYYYLTKPYDVEVMLTIVRGAINDRKREDNIVEQMENHTAAIGLIEGGLFVLKTLEEAKNLASLLALACPNAQNVVLGLGELLINAIEHGNLGITYEEKSGLIDEDEWEAEVERRLKLPENVNKKVQVRFERRPNEIRFMIEDEGEGFAWEDYLYFDPERATHAHGRGIVMARAAFSRIEYIGKGSIVVGIIEL